MFSNSDRSKLKARDKLIVREYLGNGQYRLDRVSSKSGYTTTTIKPAYDLYGISKTETKTPPRKKSVTWSQEDPQVNTQSPQKPEPGQNKPAAEQSTPTAGPWVQLYNGGI